MTPHRLTQADAIRITHHLRQLLTGRNLTELTRDAIRDAIVCVNDLVAAEAMIHDLREESARKLYGMGYPTELLFISDLFSEAAQAGFEFVRQHPRVYPCIKEIPFRTLSPESLWSRTKIAYRICMADKEPQLFTHEEFISGFYV